MEPEAPAEAGLPRRTVVSDALPKAGGAAAFDSWLADPAAGEVAGRGAAGAGADGAAAWGRKLAVERGGEFGGTFDDAGDFAAGRTVGAGAAAGGVWPGRALATARAAALVTAPGDAPLDFFAVSAADAGASAAGRADAPPVGRTGLELVGGELVG